MNVYQTISLAVLLALAVPFAGETETVSIKKTDKCPVCGMFVAKYPDFLAQIVFNDGSYVAFDGAKDLFKYYFSLQKYNAAKERSDIASVSVTDYYDMLPIDGRSARFVIGSDVFGPMGRELIPFAKEEDAKVFMQDHGGKEMLLFEAVTPEIIMGLDR